MKKLLLTIAAFVSILSPGKAQFEWVHTDGPFGGLFTSTILKSNDFYTFASTGDFLFRSEDGINWVKFDEEVNSSLAVYKNKLVALFYDTTGQIKIKFSEDHGENWVVKDVHPNVFPPVRLNISSHGIYIAQGNNSLLFRSADDGDSWESIAPPIEYGHYLWSFDEKIYLSNSLELWHTDNNGENWQNILTPVQSVNEFIVDVIVKDEHVIVSSQETIFHSHDNGNTWDYNEITFLNNAFKLALTSDAVYAYSWDLYRSNDYGDNWAIISEEANTPSLLGYTGFGDIFLAFSYNQGIFRWDDDQDQLVENNAGYSVAAIYDLAMGDDKIWAACGNGVFSLDLTTDTWSEKMDLPLPETQYGFITAESNGWVATIEEYKDYFYFSMDQGQTWDTISPMLGGPFPWFEDIDIFGDTIFLFSYADVFMSIDQGVSWTSLDIYAYDKHIIEFQGKLFINNYVDILISENGGESWLSQPLDIKINKLYTSSDLLFGISADSLSKVELYTSVDGINWVYANDNNGLPQGHVNTISSNNRTHFFRYEDSYFAFWGISGLYTTNDSFQSWTSVTPNLYGNAYLTDQNTVYLGKKGLYKSALIDDVPTETDQIDFTLDPSLIVFPNPAKDRVIIESTGNLSGEGTLFLYTMSGQLVETIKIRDTSIPILLSIEHLKNGIYILRIDMENNTKTGKIIKQ